MAGRKFGPPPGFCNGPAWQDWKRERDRYIKKAGVQSVLRLEEHAFTGPTTGYQRLVRLQRGPSDRIHRLCMLLDGETYWRDMQVVPVLNDLVSRGRVKHPPTDLLQEISQIEGVKKAVQILGEMGGTVHHHKYTGTHSLKPWREELEQALPWLTDN